MRVLIIDSSIEIIERLEEIISEIRIMTDIDRAVSYEEAKKLFKEKRHDVVLLDIELPGNESLLLLKEIKNIDGKTNVIVMFTQMDYHTLEQCKSSGVDLFFDKYYDFEKISGIIDVIGHGKENFQSTGFFNSPKKL